MYAVKIVAKLTDFMTAVVTQGPPNQKNGTARSWATIFITDWTLRRPVNAVSIRSRKVIPLTTPINSPNGTPTAGRTVAPATRSVILGDHPALGKQVNLLILVPFCATRPSGPSPLSDESARAFSALPRPSEIPVTRLQEAEHLARRKRGALNGRAPD